MYGKLFESMYHGSLRGDWETITILQQLVIIADSEGFVDKNAESIAAITGFPLDMIQRGIERLMEPDPESRSTVEDGRRIVPIVPGRSWGWEIVNYKHYANLKSNAERREYEREKKRKQREKRSVSADCPPLSPLSPNVPKCPVTEIEIETDIIKNASASPPLGFASFWSVFPSKNGKQKAVLRYKQAISRLEKQGLTKDAAVEKLKLAAESYADWLKAQPDPPKVKWAEGWLNAERYEDDYAEITAADSATKAPHGLEKLGL